MSGRRCVRRPRTPPPQSFEGLTGLDERLERLVEEIDAFYRRGALRLGLAGRDRELIPALEHFLRAVEAGVEAYVKEALAPSKPPKRTVEVVAALMSFPVWRASRSSTCRSASRGSSR